MASDQHGATSSSNVAAPIKADDFASRLTSRQGLRAANTKYWQEDPYKPSGSLDSSLKKHTTLLNRLRSAILTTPSSSVIKELDALTLTKYVEELVGAVLEGLTVRSAARADIDSAVEIISHLHARLAPDFLTSLLPQLLAACETSGLPVTTKDEKDKDREERERIARLRVVLRVVAELGLVGAWPTPTSKKEQDGPTHVLRVVTGLMDNDPQYNNVPLLITFLKSHERAYLGPGDELVSSDIQSEFTAAFHAFFDRASKALTKGHLRLLEQGKRNHEAYIKSGEIFEDRQQAYDRMAKTIERLQSSVQTLADLLNLSAPKLPSAASLEKTSLQIVDSAARPSAAEEIEVVGGIWDDDEERKFYEDLVDLADEVPPAILHYVKPTKEEQPAQQPKMSTEGAGEETAAAAVASDGEVDGDADLQVGPAARLNAIFAALPEANNRNVIDRLAVDFAFLNSKGARKRCFKFLAGVPRNRTDLLPYYARFAATLNKHMPDVGHGLIAILDEELKYLQRKKQVKELESVRIKNVRYLGELAKFKVAQTHTIFHALKVYLDDLTGPNVDNVAMLLETCGRYLLRNEETSERMKAVLELMRRKQAAQHFGARQQLLLENAYYQCNPPERVARERVELPPRQAFIHHLIQDVLVKKTIDKVLKLLRKMPWDDRDVYRYLLSTFTEIWEVKFGNISMLAMLVYDLQKYHPDFVIDLIDQVLEDVRAGMEDNIFKYNQRRIATIKYLGELYMYRVLNTPVIFDTLWSLITFGHPDGLPIPGRTSPIDAVDDFFRIRLVCTLLDTCGACFDRGSSRKKLDHFLVVFQMYILCKDELPMDVEFMVSDTFETLRPKMSRLRTIPEAAAAIDEIMTSEAINGHVDDDEDDDGERAEREDDDADVDVEMDDGAEDARIDDESSDEDVRLIGEIARRDEAYEQEASDDFEREFARMLADTTDLRKQERSKTAAPVFDTAVPIVRKGPKTATEPSDDRHMQFSLLSKKGNKQQIRTLDVPLESALARNTMTHQLQNKQEQEQLKQLVLQNERRQEQSDRAALQQSLSRTMFTRAPRQRQPDG